MALIETFLRKVKSAYDSGDGDRLALVFVHASQGEEFWRLKDELSGVSVGSIFVSFVCSIPLSPPPFLRNEADRALRCIHRTNQRTRNLSDLCARHLPGGDSDRFATLLTEYLTFIAEQPVPLSSLLQLEPEVYEGGAYNEKGKGRASIGTANGSGAGAGTNECDWARYYDAWATVYTCVSLSLSSGILCRESDSRSLFPFPPQQSNGQIRPALRTSQSRAASVFALPDTVWFIPSLRYFGTTLVALAINASILSLAFLRCQCITHF